MASKGSLYRLCKFHPGRPDQPLHAIYDKAGNVVVKAGESCANVPAKLLASMISNGYVERQGGK